MGQEEEAQWPGTSEEEAMAGFSPGVAPSIKNHAPGPPTGAPLGLPPGARPCQAMPAATATTTAMLLLPGILLLAWLPTSPAHHGHPLWEGPHPHRTPRCYSAEELPHGQPPPHLLARSARWEQALPVALVSSLEAEGHRRQHQGTLARPQCPMLRPEEVLTADTHQRSISPWRYRIDTDEDRYPRKLAFAECLCRGCVSSRTGQETAALNSVRLHQSLLVLRRHPCSPGAFAFHTEFIRVPVGCTCVLPRSTQ